ncbi:MAG TPA: hypothetical protein VFN01_15300 [Marinobacter sp.]|nr:hypothetical protein [Marinobacter sp.]HET8802539.1 hypothetical protein [Marinobacter sp.]
MSVLLEMAVSDILNGQPNTVIFRRALLFVYGLAYSSQKPERQKYTDTI